jgi:hypothetical protein
MSYILFPTQKTAVLIEDFMVFLSVQATLGIVDWDITAFLHIDRVSGYRSRGPGFDSQRFQIF